MLEKKNEAEPSAGERGGSGDCADGESDLHEFFFYYVGNLRDLHGDEHSFPTRRSSDLGAWDARERERAAAQDAEWRQQEEARVLRCRSEEHTSELQSLITISYAVFC